LQASAMRNVVGPSAKGDASLKEVVNWAMARFSAERTSGLPKPLLAAMDALSDEHFRQLKGWVLFGRDYSIEDGDALEQLREHIEKAIIEPRMAESAYLESKPIGQYLRQAEKHLLGTDQTDLVNDDDEPDYQ